jgi:hypothetical protein
MQQAWSEGISQWGSSKASTATIPGLHPIVDFDDISDCHAFAYFDDATGALASDKRHLKDPEGNSAAEWPLMGQNVELTASSWTAA